MHLTRTSGGLRDLCRRGLCLGLVSGFPPAGGDGALLLLVHVLIARQRAGRGMVNSIPMTNGAHTTIETPTRAGTIEICNR
jgi:hypothetical protein